jgi:transcriptional regulator GlxA family with amidase domain
VAEGLMRNVVILVFPGTNLLDVAGPAQVFTSAAELHRAANPGEQPAYSVTLASLHGGLVATTSGIGLNSSPISDLREKDIDTLLIAGVQHEASTASRKNSVSLEEKIRNCGWPCAGSTADRHRA